MIACLKKSGGKREISYDYRARGEVPELPGSVLWKTELLFRGVRYTEALKQAAEEGAAPNYWPYPLRDGDRTHYIPVPYLFRVNGAAVARVRVNDQSDFFVRRRDDGAFVLRHGEREACEIDFVQAHKWQSFRTSDGAKQMEAGVEQLGDMLVVNMAPGCEYFRVKDEAGHSHKCSFCAYGRFGERSTALGQVGGRVAIEPTALRRLSEILEAAVDSGQLRHIYLTGGSMLDPALEVERFLPTIETARRVVGDRLRITCGSGAVDPEGSRRYRDAGADSCCYNLETWDPETFRTACSGKSTYVGRERWINGLLGAVDVFGRGNVNRSFSTRRIIVLLERVSAAVNFTVPFHAVLLKERGYALIGRFHIVGGRRYPCRRDRPRP